MKLEDFVRFSSLCFVSILLSYEWLSFQCILFCVHLNCFDWIDCSATRLPYDELILFQSFHSDSSASFNIVEFFAFLMCRFWSNRSAIFCLPHFLFVCYEFTLMSLINHRFSIHSIGKLFPFLDHFRIQNSFRFIEIVCIEWKSWPSSTEHISSLMDVLDVHLFCWNRGL